MDKKLQDLAWQCLPLEVKKEVKRLYKTRRNKRLNEVSSDFIYCLVYIFGKHNLTSDAEGEVMLMCAKSKVHEIYLYNEDILSQDPTHSGAILLKKKLQDLFGSKCLPDEEPLFSKSPENYNNESLIVDSENKPAEPKFNLGDIVRFKYCCATYRIDGFKMSDGVMLYQVGEVWAEESDLEPYTEPTDTTDKNPKENANTFASDGLARLENDHLQVRLQVAAMAMQGILANPDRLKQYGEIAMRESGSLVRLVARNVLRYADALIAEHQLPHEAIHHHPA